MMQWWQEPNDNFFDLDVASTSSCHFLLVKSGKNRGKNQVQTIQVACSANNFHPQEMCHQQAFAEIG